MLIHLFTEVIERVPKDELCAPQLCLLWVASRALRASSSHTLFAAPSKERKFHRLEYRMLIHRYITGFGAVSEDEIGMPRALAESRGRSPERLL